MSLIIYATACELIVCWRRKEFIKVYCFILLILFIVALIVLFLSYQNMQTAFNYCQIGFIGIYFIYPSLYYLDLEMRKDYVDYDEHQLVILKHFDIVDSIICFLILYSNFIHFLIFIFIHPHS